MNVFTYTIGIPIYERLFGFEEALYAALAVRGCTEILVIDNNSSHNKFEQICNSVRDSRLRYVRNNENIGMFGNWNRVSELATSEYVSILCSDDLIAANAFELFLEATKVNSEIDVFFGSFASFTKSIEDSTIIKEFKDGKVDSFEFIKDLVVDGPGFPVLSIMKKEIGINYPFVANPYSGNDWLWIYSNALSLKLHATNTVFSYWRRHDDQGATQLQSVTMDCWPMMYKSVARQLVDLDLDLSKKALRRAKGVILSWLINEYSSDKRLWKNRILNGKEENNIFMNVILEVVSNDWILSSLIFKKKNNSIFYNLGRIIRKAGYYPI